MTNKTWEKIKEAYSEKNYYNTDININSRYNISKLKFKMFVLGPILVIISLGIFLFVGVLPLIKFYDAKNWPTTQCKIIKSDISSYQEKAKDGYVTNYKNDLLYEFEINGNKFISNYYGFDYSESSNLSFHQNILNNYQVGKIYPCYYNPKTKREIVLNRDLNKEFLFIAVLFGTFIPAVYYFSYKRYRKYNPKKRDVNDFTNIVTTNNDQSN